MTLPFIVECDAPAYRVWSSPAAEARTRNEQASAVRYVNQAHHVASLAHLRRPDAAPLNTWDVPSATPTAQLTTGPDERRYRAVPDAYAPQWAHDAAGGMLALCRSELRIKEPLTVAWFLPTTADEDAQLATCRQTGQPAPWLAKVGHDRLGGFVMPAVSLSQLYLRADLERGDLLRLACHEARHLWQSRAWGTLEARLAKSSYDPLVDASDEDEERALREHDAERFADMMLRSLSGR